MKQVKEVIVENPISTYMGSEKTLEHVKEAIKEHPQLGPKYVKDFDPYHSAMTYGAWKRQGYIVSKGAKAIKSVTFVEAVDPDTGEKKMIRKSVNLFHRIQVDTISPLKLKSKQAI